MMKKILSVCLAALAAFGVQAQTLELGLQEAIEISLDENPTIKIAGMEIERQRMVKNETIGGFLPSISGEALYNRAVKKAGGMQGSMSPDNTVNLTGTVGLPIVVPALFQTLKLNNEQMRAAVEAARASKIELVNGVKKAYYGILMAEEALAVLQSSEKNTRQTVEETRTKYESGLASEYDLVTAEVQLSNLQPSIYQAQNGLQTAWKMFRMLLELPEEVEVNLTDNFEELAVSMTADVMVDHENVAGNTDLRAMEIQRELMRRQLGVLRTQRLPSLAAFGSIASTGMELPGFDLSSMAITTGEFKWSTPISVGARLSVPLFAGFTNVSRERQLKNQIRQLEMQRDYREQSVRVEADNAQANVGMSFSKMIAGRTTITQAQKGYDIAKVRFDGGMGTILELNSAELALTNARMNYAQAVYDYLSAQADYEKILGRCVPAE